MIFIASIATRSLSSGELHSSKFIHIGRAVSDGSKIITSSARFLGIKGIKSLAKSPCGSITASQFQFAKSCLAITCKIDDFHVPVCHIT
jgi:hypothetical protein